MIHRSGHRAVRCPSLVTLLRCMVILLGMAGITVAAVVGDQVELKATPPSRHALPPGTPWHE